MAGQASKRCVSKAVLEAFAAWSAEDEKRRMEIAWAMSALNLDKLTERQLQAVEYLLDRIRDIPEANNVSR